MKIIQIGCHIGNDHVYSFITENINNIENLYLIDANIHSLKECKENYANIEGVTFLNYAITPTDDEYIDIVLPFNELTSSHVSTFESHLIKHNHANLIKQKVKAININKLFEELNLSVIDRVYIDTEGLDIQIINSIDYSKINIKYLMFEYIHSDGTLSWGGENLYKCLMKLLDLGYSLKKEEYNIIATKQ
jgi:hypothetical protein